MVAEGQRRLKQMNQLFLLNAGFWWNYSYFILQQQNSFLTKTATLLSLLYQRQQFCNSLFCELSDSSIYVHSATHILVNSSNCMMPVLFPSCLYVWELYKIFCWTCLCSCSGIFGTNKLQIYGSSTYENLLFIIKSKGVGRGEMDTVLWY